MNAMKNIEGSKRFRLGRLFRADTERTFMVALDHGQGGLQKGMEQPELLMKSLIEADPDAVLMGPGLLRRFRHLFGFRGAPALILSLDMFLDGTLPKEDVEGMEAHRFTTTIQEAVRLGVDAVKVLMIWGRDSVAVQADNFQHITRICEESQKWNLPVIVEPTLWGPRAKQLSDEEKKSVILDIARIGFELGGDMIKIEAPSEIIPKMVSAVPIPITLLGGAPKGSMEVYLQDLQSSIRQGVVGAVVGRRVWQSDDISATVSQFKEAVYGA